MVHLQRFQEDAAKADLHHPEGTLDDRACPGVMAVKALGSHTLQRLSVRSDEGEWMLEAGVPPVGEDVLPWRRVECPPVQWTVAEHSTVVDRPRPAHVRVNEAAPMVTNCLQNY